MLIYDYNETLGLSLVTDNDGMNCRYEKMKPRGCAPLAPLDHVYLRQMHYVANAIVSGPVIVGKRIEIVPSEWKRNAGVSTFGQRRTA